MVSFTSGEYCVESPDYYYLTFTLGYPLELANAFAIESGASYTLRHRVKGFASYEVKTGQAVEPYTELVSVISTSTASSSYVPEVRTLVGTLSDPQAGLALNGFLAAGESLCFDDISLVQDQIRLGVPSGVVPVQARTARETSSRHAARATHS